MLVRYKPSSFDIPQELAIATEGELDVLMEHVTGQRGERGVPALELVGTDGSTLVVGQVRQGAVLLWIDALGASLHSVGSAATEDTVVFDYFGSYTEVPAEFVVPRSLGRSAALRFMSAGTPFVTGLTMEPD